MLAGQEAQSLRLAGTVEQSSRGRSLLCVPSTPRVQRRAAHLLLLTPGLPLAPSQLCVVMIFLVSVIMYRGIVSVMMYHTGNAILMTQVSPVPCGDSEPLPPGQPCGPAVLGVL